MSSYFEFFFPLCIYMVMFFTANFYCMRLMFNYIVGIKTVMVNLGTQLP